MSHPSPRGLYDPAFEHDGCGVGMVADLSGRPRHRTLRLGLEALARLNHRGALSADGRSGDGAGILAGLPEKLFGRDRAVGVFFIPENVGRTLEGITELCRRHRVEAVAWRKVPLRTEVLGEQARRTLPAIYHLIAGGDISRINLYRLRRTIERRHRCCVASFSSKVIVYKGLVSAIDLPSFYLDLGSPDFETAFVLFHQRFSTNTFPAWPLAQPFRMLAHNGEINTVTGNRIWWRCREALIGASVWGEERKELFPVIQDQASDSMSLDNVMEFLTLSGQDMFQTVMALMPQAWENDPDLPPELSAFYRYQACRQEPWDGPAALVFTDGERVGAALDRNGFRPLRYTLTRGGLLVAASEQGVLDLDPGEVVEKGDCRPGQLLGADLRTGRLLRNAEIKAEVSTRKPYLRWVDQNLRTLEKRPAAPSAPLDTVETVRRQIAFGISREEWEFVLKPLAGGKEPTGSMGDDTPLAVLSEKRRSLFDYFRQRFAQVTNPPMDPLREACVMSLQVCLGPGADPLEEGPSHCRKIVLDDPLISPGQLDRLESEAPSRRLSLCFEPSGNLKKALQRLKREAEEAAGAGKWLLILSDRDMNAGRLAVPSALALGCLHHHLIDRRLRGRVELVVESGEIRDAHQAAVLMGYGASAACPRLIHDLLGDSPQWDNYHRAILEGLRKILSKMGICTLAGYRGARIFEILGLSNRLVEQCFRATPSPIGGIGLEELEADVRARHREAYAAGAPELPLGGLHRYRRGEEVHAFQPRIVKTLHAVARGKENSYQRFREELERMPAVYLRDLLAFREQTPAPLDDVEPVGSICRRFTTAAMSLGALSPEAHEVLALAMNRIGAKSNTGEGGEPRERLLMRGSRRDSNSRIKQVASGRFGVTAEYLVSARELQIKIAQGSKPGEGGQLPGSKVNGLIARLRHTAPGTPLISPPPHHDIYSIEDLAQLIDDLRQVNPGARVSVKLVSQAGVGTVAAGVVKAGADAVVISGGSGGTGASPRNSIKHAGSPWELGLAEVNQVLRLNDLRCGVRLAVDGGLKSGRDVMVAALLGADEFGFGTSALIASGCVMARACHLNTCPVGVATQRADLREKFPRDPERVIRYLRAVAEEVRHWLARLGFRTVEESIGRADLLRPRAAPGPGGAGRLDLSRLLHREPASGRNRAGPRPGAGLCAETLQLASRGSGGSAIVLPIRNNMRSVGADLAGRIARDRLAGKTDRGRTRVRFQGTAGLSFGCFCEEGLELTLVGEANDFVGKGMAGGTIVLRPPPGGGGGSHSIAGNTVLYGATGGRLFAAGRVGERFAVRNSGALAVVEGVGDHGCEYMTGGTVLILGPVGRNFGAGMTGGVAYVFDPASELQERLSSQSVMAVPVHDRAEREGIRRLVRRHQHATGSALARKINASWDVCRRHFWKVVPGPGQEALKGSRGQPSAGPRRATRPGRVAGWEAGERLIKQREANAP